MEIKELINHTNKPGLYEPGTVVMWTDPHISKQLLHIHLHPDLDLASRKRFTFESTAKWVLDQANTEQMNILDLGCGPGLYSEIFTRNGHRVTGVDFSENSIKYAKEEAVKEGLDITYLHQNYLELDVPDNSFDMVTLIYTDLGVLNPDDRKVLLGKIQKALKPDESEKVVLSQHVVAEDKQTEVYRFWTHFFSHEDISGMLMPHGFKDLSFHEDVLPVSDIWNGDNVTFCIAFNHI